VRGIIEARALITERIKDLTIEGRTVHQVFLPYHYGYEGLVKGNVANDLLAISEEPNVRIMETKALVCNLKKGTLPKNQRALGILQKELKRPA